MKLTNNQEIILNQIIKKLKDKKIKITDIRIYIIKLLIISNHLTIQQIIENLTVHYKNINKMSVYNTMDLLINENIVFANTFDGKKIVYEILAKKSVHLNCHSCNKIYHLEQKEISKLNLNYLSDILKNKIIPDHYKIEVHGICINCIKI